MATPGTIAMYAYDAGLRDEAGLAAAVTIALAESGGNERAHNAIPPDDSYGLWQINMRGSLGPERRQTYGLKANTDLYDGPTNARVMMGISGGGKNWKPWSTYNGARYKILYPVGLAAAKLMIFNGPLSQKAGEVQKSVGDAIDSAGQLANAVTGGVNQIGKAGSWLSNRNNIFRLVKVAAGLALVGVGISMAARPYITRAAGSVVQAVVPIGKAGKAIAGGGK